MITDKITVYGDKQETINICDLLTKCVTETDAFAESVEVYLQKGLQKTEDSDQGKIKVIPFDMKDSFPHGVSTITYSDSDSDADVSAVNPQKREKALCFELLCGVFMSRVFIPDTSKYTQQQVLVCASVLYALGVPMKKVVSLINESLK